NDKQCALASGKSAGAMEVQLTCPVGRKEGGHMSALSRHRQQWRTPGGEHDPSILAPPTAAGRSTECHTDSRQIREWHGFAPKSRNLPQLAFCRERHPGAV